MITTSLYLRQRFLIAKNYKKISYRHKYGICFSILFEQVKKLNVKSVKLAMFIQVTFWSMKAG